MEARDSFVGGHVRPSVKKALDEEAEDAGVSVSEMLDMIIAEYFGMD